MKNSLYIILIAILTIACKETTTTEPIEKENTQLFKSHNVKTNGKQYFTFSTNSGTTIESTDWDIAFGSVPLTVETSPCQFFTMPNDPVILCSAKASITKIDASSLKDVTKIPNVSKFKNDVIAGTPFIGKSWFNSAFKVIQDVYVIKTCSGNFALLQISKYDIDMSIHQITSIYWSYKYNNNGSTDFSTSASISFNTQNAYNKTRYFSFENGTVTKHDSYDLRVEGSSLWLGPNVKAKKLGSVLMGSITSITDDSFYTDIAPTYITTGWYSYGEGHTLTPKDYVYVVKTADSKHIAFEIKNYYDDEGKSGTYTIEWKYLK